jgi:hypothetical protein
MTIASSSSRRLLLFAAAACFFFAAGKEVAAAAATAASGIEEEAPTCVNGSDRSSCPDDDNASPTKENDTIPCDLYWYEFWMYAGREYARGDILSYGSYDPIIAFTQQTRKAFPRWNRYHHFHQVDFQPYHFHVAPGLAEWPLECHPRLYNVRSTPKNLTDASTSHSRLVVDRIVLPGEPILQECIIDERTTGLYTIDTIPYQSIDEVLKKEGICLDTVVYNKVKDKDKTKEPQPNEEYIVTAKRPLQVDDVITMGLAVHMHRAEFWNASMQMNEPLIAYTYGHPQSDLLLLPMAPIFASVRTTDDPTKVNTKLAFDMDDPDMETYLYKPTRYQFGQYEQAILYVKLIATKPVKVGEVLYIYKNQTVGGERPVPDNFFPSQWLQREKRALLDPVTHEFQFDNTLDLPKLAPGTVGPATVSTTQQPLGHYLHRVGLPPNLIPTMTAWGEKLGVLDHLRRYVDDKTLDIGGEERTIFQNGTWWVRRFDYSWQSNMHYVAVDDDESQEQFFAALYKGGFDTVLQGVGEYFNLTQLTCYYTTFIVVSHCVQSMMHSDSDYPNVFNMIFPITQVNDGEAELVLGADDDPSIGGTLRHSPELHIPYVYERDHAILVGHGGMHGTSPTDYRDGKGSHRVVMSVYMGDFSNPAMRKAYIDAYEDPPYANYWPGQLDHAFTERVHWKKDDPSVSIGNAMPRKFPKHRPPPAEPKPPRRRYDTNKNNVGNDNFDDDEMDYEEIE